MTTQGQPKFNALAIGAISADFTGTNVKVTAKAAFVNTETGATHGWTDGSGSVWSKETMAHLGALAASMEKDLAAIHFGERPASAPAEAGVSLSPPGGLSEHLRGEAPQV